MKSKLIEAVLSSIHQLASIGAMIEEFRFTADSPMEGAGFEHSVPLSYGADVRDFRGAQGGRGVAAPRRRNTAARRDN